MNKDKALNLGNTKYISTGGNSYSKLKALIKKNIIVLKRNKGTTFCEIFFPIALILLLLIIRKAFSIKEYDFETEDQTTENMIYQKSVANVDYTNPNINSTNNNSFIWYGLTILPSLFICSSSNKQKTKRPIIATIGIPDLIKQKIIMDSVLYQTLFNISVSNDNFKDFNNIEEMEKYIGDETYGTQDKPLICFGMGLEEKNNTYNYSLHYFDSIFDEGIQDLSDIIRGPIDLFQSGPDMESYQKTNIVDILI